MCSRFVNIHKSSVSPLLRCLTLFDDFYDSFSYDSYDDDDEIASLKHEIPRIDRARARFYENLLRSDIKGKYLEAIKDEVKSYYIRQGDVSEIINSFGRQRPTGRKIQGSDEFSRNIEFDVHSLAPFVTSDSHDERRQYQLNGLSSSSHEHDIRYYRNLLRRDVVQNIRESILDRESSWWNPHRANGGDRHEDKTFFRYFSYYVASEDQKHPKNIFEQLSRDLAEVVLTEEEKRHVVGCEYWTRMHVINP